MGSSGVSLNVVTGGLSVSGQLAQTAGNVGFHGVAPVAQHTDSGQMAATGATSVAPFGFTTAAQADSIATIVNSLRDTLRQLGLMT